MKIKQNSTATKVIAVVATIIILAIIGFLVWFFGFRNTGPASGVNNSQPSQAAASQAEPKIKQNWTTFFKGSTPAAKRVALLQNGQQFAQPINQLGKSKTAKAISVDVSKVEVKTATQATVSYTINIDGQPALQNQTGQAILINGTWKVSDASLCGLLKLTGSLPPNCPGAKASSTNQSQPQSQASSKPASSDSSAKASQ